MSQFGVHLVTSAWPSVLRQSANLYSFEMNAALYWSRLHEAASHLRLTVSSRLNRWTGHRTVRTENATVAS